MTKRYEKVDENTIKEVYENENIYTLDEVKKHIDVCEQEISLVLEEKNRWEEEKKKWEDILQEMKNLNIIDR